MNQGIFILTIGDEILNGHTVNTNAAFFGKELKNLGMAVSEMRTVADQEDAIIHALQDAKKFANVIVTGGLGPTSDDITAESAAKAFAVKYVQNPIAANQIEDFLLKKKVEVTDLRMRASWMPANVQVLRNEWGTAPAFKINQDKSNFYFLPGVPGECRPMFAKYIESELRKSVMAHKRIHHEVWRCFGQKEADLFAPIDQIVSQLQEKFGLSVAVHCLIVWPGVDIHFEVWDHPNFEAPSAAYRKVISDKLNEQLKPYCYSRKEGESLAEVVVAQLKSNQQKLATAESCTGGLVAKLLTDSAGVSEIFDGGMITYANSAKEKFLEVPMALLAEHGAVSHECVKAMAEGVRKKFNSDYGIALSGISGPDGGSAEKPVGTIYVGFAGPAGTKSVHQQIATSHDTRSRHRIFASHLAFDLLRINIKA